MPPVVAATGRTEPSTEVLLMKKLLPTLTGVLVAACLAGPAAAHGDPPGAT